MKPSEGEPILMTKASGKLLKPKRTVLCGTDRCETPEWEPLQQNKETESIPLQNTNMRHVNLITVNFFIIVYVPMYLQLTV